MRDLLSDALNRLSRQDGVDYADARIVDDERESLLWSNLGAFVCPAMLVERWTFTGQSR